MQRSEKILWGVGLAIQILLVIGALSLSWVFEYSTSRQADLEQVALAKKNECTFACQQYGALLTQANREHLEALRYSNKAIMNFALAILILTILQLAIYIRFIRRRAVG
jgi:hypothetical protein